MFRTNDDTAAESKLNLAHTALPGMSGFEPRSVYWRTAAVRVGRLTEHKLTLIAVLLALRALWHPYLGLVHDAKLYSLQVAKHLSPGTYQDDLFFAFGSQDSYSIFAYLTAPLASWLGIELAFFVIWLGCMALLLWAELALVSRLAIGRLTAALAMVLFTVSDLPYAGAHVFHVHEPFLTARLPAEIAAIAALTQLCDRRYFRVLLLLILAMLLHPIMGVSSVLVAAGFGLGQVLGVRRVALWITLACALPTMLLLIPGVATHLLERFDPLWLVTARAVSPHCFLTDWSLSDALQVVGTLVVLFAGRRFPGAAPAQLVFWVAYVAAAGVATTALAEWTESTFLVQGQAYRALWLAEVTAIPVGLTLMLRLWKQATRASRVGALATAVYLLRPLSMSTSVIPLSVEYFWLWGILSLAAYVVLRARRPGLAGEHVWWNSIALALVGTSVWVSIDGFVAYLHVIAKLPPWPLTTWRFGTHVVTLAILFLVTAVAIVVAAGYPRPRRLALPAIIAWLIVAIVPYLLTTSPAIPEPLRQADKDVDFVKTQLAGRLAAERNGTVYWPADPTSIWLDLQTTSYFSHTQVVGAVFSRELCHVAAGRIELVRPFEIDWMKNSNLPDAAWKTYLRLLQTDLSGPAPRLDDLLRVAADPAVGWIVCRHRFGELAEATNGSVYIYDAQALRDRRAAKLQRRK